MQTKTTSSSLVLEVPHATRNTVHLCECYLCISSRTRTVSAPDVPGSPQACPPSSCSRCVITRFRKQPGCLRRIKMRRKKGICTSNEWMIHAKTNHHHRLESNNQAIGLRVTLFGRKWLSIPARTANSCVRRYLLRWERDGSFRTEMCQVLRQEKATQVLHSLARAALALMWCHPSVWKIGSAVCLGLTETLWNHVYGPIRTVIFLARSHVHVSTGIIWLCVTPKSGEKNVG